MVQTRCFRLCEDTPSSYKRALSRYVMRPQFSIAPAVKSGRAIMSDGQREKSVWLALAKKNYKTQVPLVRNLQFDIFFFYKSILNRHINSFLLLN